MTRRRAPNGAGLAFCLAVASETSGEGCRDWPYGQGSKGYGLVGPRRATHLVLEFSGRPRPEGRIYALHSCDRPVCIAPWHLRWGTPAENTQEAYARGLAKALAGEDNVHAVLTEQAVRDIRSRYGAGGVKQRELAVEYGVTQTQVSKIVTGRSWKSQGMPGDYSGARAWGRRTITAEVVS